MYDDLTGPAELMAAYVAAFGAWRLLVLLVRWVGARWS
jgi:hypothetical protein